MDIVTESRVRDPNPNKTGAPNVNLGKYLFGRQFEI